MRSSLLLFAISFAPYDFVGAETSKQEESSSCGLYLAVSTTSLPEEPTWGVFAGKDITTHSAVAYPEVAINLHNFRSHSLTDDYDDSYDELFTFYNGLFWVPEMIGAANELSDGATANCPFPGIGMLSADKPELTNAKWDTLSSLNRPLLGEDSGAAHPSRGALSPFHSLVAKASKDIKKGMEIFLDIGESQASDNTLSHDDLSKIDELVEKINSYFTKYSESLNKEARSKMYNFLVKDVLTAAVGAAKAREIAKKLPQDPDELQEIINAGGILSYTYDAGYRTIEWLEENGLCMDNIRSGASTIPNAGRGAFATRNIKKGGLVAPVPLLHFPDLSIFNMYELEYNNDDEYVRASNTVIGKQLIVNYLYGHPESTMGFFPAGATSSLINQSDEPNAKLVWSNHPKHNRNWLTVDPSELGEEPFQSIGLLMEIVATRDIEPNEEIFIDYGPEWKQAWAKHVAQWESKIASGEIPKTWPLKAVDLNHKYNNTFYETEEELNDKNQYIDNVELRAFMAIGEMTYSGSLEDPFPWGSDEYSENGPPFPYDLLVPVTIVRREDDAEHRFTYTVRWIKGDKTYHVSGVPHYAIVFVDKPESSDQFVEEPFRHYIGIPDDIFPKGPWRNKA